MSSHTRAVLALALISSSAMSCGGAGPAADGIGVPRVDPPERSGLVWLATEDGRLRTLWVSLDDGSPLTSQPLDGAVFAESDSLWQWTENEIDVPTWDEPPPEEDPDPATATGTGTVREVVLRDLVEDLTASPLEAPVPGVIRSVEHDVTLEATVGPYLFIVSSLSLDAFGAHGHQGYAAIVFDVRGAAEAEILTEREREEVLASAAARALEELGDGEPPTFEAIHPSWEDGRLVVRLRYAREACYACSDGRWSDYTVSVTVPAEAPLERLAPYSTVPAWAAAAAATVPDARMGGFSIVDHAGPAQALEALRR